MQRIEMVPAVDEGLEVINGILAEGWEVVGAPQAVMLPPQNFPQTPNSFPRDKGLLCLLFVLEKHDDPPPETRRDKWDSEQ